MYKLKLGEVITTIPTIGFNVETIEHKHTKFTMWDVGGCDKIRPLWRHYYQNTQAVVFVVDSNDRDRFDPAGEWYMNATGAFHEILKENELKDCVVLVYCNKQDLPNALTPAEIKHKLSNNGVIDGKLVRFQSCCAPTGDGLLEGLDWLCDTLKAKRDGKSAVTDAAATSQDATTSSTATKVKTEEEQNAERMENTLLEWLQREDDSDDHFLQQLAEYTLDSWDHRTHLRIAYIHLTRYPRKQAMECIFSAIKAFIANSTRTQRSRGTTFHETMTYFWVHMVHFALVATKLPQQNFKTFLLMNPQLVNGGLFLHYYSKKRMLHDADARMMVLLPDKLPLPSIVSTTTTTQAVSRSVIDNLPRQPLTDTEFLRLFMQMKLPGWGHDVKIRAIYLLVCRYGHNSAADKLTLGLLQAVERSGFHYTISYFWLHLVALHVLRAMKADPTVVADAYRSSSSDGNSGVVVAGDANVEETIRVDQMIVDHYLCDDRDARNDGATESIFHSFPSGANHEQHQTTAKTISPPTCITANVLQQRITTASSSTTLSFAAFYQQPQCQQLKNSLLHEHYFSRSAVDSVDAINGLVLPDLKAFPNFVH